MLNKPAPKAKKAVGSLSFNWTKPTVEVFKPKQVIAYHYSPDSSALLVYPESYAGVEQAASFIASRNTAYSYDEIYHIVSLYKQYGDYYGVDWVIALAQNLHETDFLNSWWSQPPRRNPAGLLVTGQTSSTKKKDYVYDSRSGIYRKGWAFATWEEAIQRHYRYVILYSTTNPTSRQQEALSSTWYSFRYLGVAKTLRGFQGTWAVPGTNYANRLAHIANNLVE